MKTESDHSCGASVIEVRYPLPCRTKDLCFAAMDHRYGVVFMKKPRQPARVLIREKITILEGIRIIIRDEDPANRPVAHRPKGVLHQAPCIAVTVLLDRTDDRGRG